MAIIRKRNFTTIESEDTNDFLLIDTAEKLLRYINVQGLGCIPLDVEAIAKKFGISVEPVSLKNDMSGILSKNEEKNSWVIQVNKDHHQNRQRYTIAHELGHFCLHRHLKTIFEDKIFFRGGESSNKVEWQANEFASAILMPEQTFREKVRSGMKTVDKLAKEFQVSTLALRIRAKTLGMSGHGL